MAEDKRISELPAATEPLNDADLVEVVQGGVNKKAPKSAFGGGAVDSVNGQTGVVQINADDVPFTPAGNIAATDVQAAIEELDSEKAPLANSKTLPIKCTDDVTPIGVATVFTFRMPYAMTLTGIRAGLTTAQASGSIFTVDVREAGVTILSTLITIDNTEKTSVTAATPPVISDTSLADDAEITILVTQIGNGSAIGLQVTFIGS